jgi:phosphopantothenoylcysteine synthetase/decarboxylase
MIFLIMSAAVADYRPSETSSKKIKKEENLLRKIELTENEDIISTINKGGKLLWVSHLKLMMK